MTELRVSHLIDEADELLDNKFHVGSYCLFMNTDDIQDILSKIRAILPEEIKTAEMILKRRDDIYMEAQSRADRIISEAQNTAANILSESELIRAVREKAAKIQEQVKESCEEMKNKAAEEAEAVRRSAYQDAMQTKEGAQAYAEQVLNNLERDIEQIHRIVRNGQDYLSQQKDKAKALPSDYNNSKSYVEK
ncbi:TPA: hypothetical protein IAA87_10675 [Candidatus Avigastranaerophilus faecigallinarum]|nr:hypothetical protein [Candidatus Avigastranaerophilus faecigallinarum]